MKVKNKFLQDENLERSARLKKIRLYLGMTREQFGKIIGISQYTIRSWENGAKNFTSKGVQRIINLLEQKLNFTCAFDWLMHGSGYSPIILFEEKTQHIYDEINIDSAHERLLKEIVFFKKMNQNTKVIVVSDMTFAPIAEIGDYMGFQPINITFLHKFIGKILLITYRDGSSLFGILRKQKNYYAMYRFMNKTKEILNENNTENISQLVWFKKA